MDALLRITVHTEQDEVFEFDTSRPVIHIVLPAGRFFITVRCAQQDTLRPPAGTKTH